jgi:CBS-domain-containing membrane protein
MEKESLKPVEGAARAIRRRLPLKGELMLAALPTATVLLVLGLVEVLSEQRLLFASLASSAFLIYLDPQHGMNSVRSLMVAQMGAALLGVGTFLLLGPGYDAAALAMVLTILLMILADAVHPPAVSTALSFALRAGDESNVLLFGLAVGITALLVLLERAALWMLARYAGGKG